MGQAFWVAGDVVWWPRGREADRERVAVVTVSYNTRELTALLLWSLRTIVDWPDLEIVVVDNGSRDGSAELLADAARAGLCVVLANDVNRQHGPGLNQGISWLASRQGPLPAWLWLVDSDIVAARPDALSAAVAVGRGEGAALIGEPQGTPWPVADRFGLYSLLMDPAVVWHERTGPFIDDGEPGSELLTSAVRLGIPMAAFPYTAAGHVIHRGRGSLASVYAAGDSAHPHYWWAIDHHEPHFAGVPGADRRYAALLRRFRDETGPLTAATLVAGAGADPGGLASGPVRLRCDAGS